MTAARCSLETRQMNLTPLALVGTRNTSAKFLSWIGNRPTCATKVKCVSAEPGGPTDIYAHVPREPDAGDIAPGVGFARHIRVDVGRPARHTRRHVAVDRR